MADPDYSRDFKKFPCDVILQLMPDPNAFRVFAAIILRARYSSGPALVGAGGVFDLEVGDAVLGRDELARECHITPSKVRTSMARLEALGIIATKTTSRGTIVTLCGFKDSHASPSTKSPAESPTDRKPIANRSQTDHQHIATNKKKKGEGRRKKEEEKVADATSLSFALEPSGPAQPSEHTRARAHYASRFQAHYDAAPTWKGREGKLLSGLLETHDADEVIKRTNIMFDHPRAYSASDRDFATLANHFDKFVKPPSPTNGSTPNARIGRAAPATPEAIANDTGDL